MKRGGKGGKGGKKKRQEREEASDLNENDEDLNLMDQANMDGPDVEDLTREQQEEVIYKTLDSNNPQAAQNQCLFSFEKRQWIVSDQVDHLVFHVKRDGNLLMKDSDEALFQEEYWEIKQKNDKKHLEAMNREIEQEFGQDPLKGKGDDKAIKKSLRNQFIYQERSSQSFNLPMREKGMKTQPPVCTTFTTTLTQWGIFDAYMQEFEDIQRQELEEQMRNKKDKNKPQIVAQQHVEDPLYSQSMKRALKIMERIIVQNADVVKFRDYKYYPEDNAFEILGADYASVLPLWRFSTEKSRKKKHVTSIQWNPKYKDLFVVSYGSYDFLRQSTGLICLYTIKNPTWPEYSFTTESGVMCVDFHPQNPALLATGLYDGTVMVFDIRLKGNNKPIYMSNVRTNKHTDPVWQVKWNEDISSKNLNFYSISSDGRVTNWTLMKNKLEAEEVIKLKMTIDQNKGMADQKKDMVYGLAGGMCFDFNMYQEHLFLVGTEEGNIHLCSKAYSGQYLETYDGHYLAVYSVKWNKFHPRMFLSCSADWTVKMWDMKITRPMMTFDLGNAVGDVEWAPYSSTTFSAVTSQGTLYIWDLHQDKHSHLCEHQAMRKSTNNKALHISFNPIDRIILVGDEMGGVNSFKLIGNSLTKGPMVYVPSKDEEKDEKKKIPSSQELEQEKMENFLDSLDKHVY